MRKDALTMVLITAVAGVFGAFARWLQNINAFEPDTGLMEPLARTTVIMTGGLAAAALLFAVLAVAWTRRFACEKDPVLALRAYTVVPDLLCKLCGVVMIVLGVVLMFAAPGQRYPTLERLFAAACIFDGVSMLFTAFRIGGFVAVGRGVTLIPVLFGCMWLICTYKNNAENPVIWAYLVELLAVVATVMGWYELSAYRYGRGKPAAALFFVQCAAFMNIATLSDGHPAIMTVVFAIQAALMLMFEFVLVENYVPRRHARRSNEQEA